MMKIRMLFLGGLLFFGSLWGESDEKEESEVYNRRNREEDYIPLERPENISLEHIQEAWTAAPPKAGIYKVGYQEDQVVRLKTRPFMTTTIVLPKWEEISDISLGDDHFFVAEKKGDHIVFLFAKKEGCDTSLIVIGKTGIVYPFYVRAEGISSSQVSDIVVYIEANAMRDTFLEEKPWQAEEIDYLQKVPFFSENLTFSFDMFQKDQASRSIAPERVYSDGIWTWLDYGKTWNIKPLPAVYQRIDGVDTPVNTRIAGSKIIVHGLPPLTLKSGQKIICIEKTES